MDSIKKVFISYSTKDREWVKNYLLKHLEENNISCHIDYRDFKIGPPILVNIEKAFEQTAKTIVVYSPGWVESKWTLFEAMILQTEDPINMKNKMLPIMFKQCKVPRRMKMFTYADFTDKNIWDTQLQRLINQIRDDFDIIEEKKKYPVLEDKFIDINRMPQTGFELYGRQKELALLNLAWESEKTHVLSFVAYGGVGKSTLINKWLEKMRWDNFRGAERVFAWSFYSQGTNEYVTSADVFFDFTLRWFGDKHPEKGSPWDKGKRLAGLVNEQKTLIILDGLEPLQSGLEIEKGQVKDPALSVFIRELSKQNKGLCIITTREHVPGLDKYLKKTKQVNLEQISEEAGIKLLTLRGVRGTGDELKNAVKSFGNHALAVQLLGEYLHRIPHHPVQKAFEVPDMDIPIEKGKHPRRMIEVISREICAAGPGKELLFILGLFDRPVEKKVIDTIVGSNPLVGLTEHLNTITKEDWLTLLDRLRKCKLLAKESEHRRGIIDCHPLVREHFGEKLMQHNPGAWKQAHERLYEYYKNLPGKELPGTLEEMEPLFAAVRHGCLAGKHQEVLDDVFYNRIRRKNEFYTFHKLGAFGADLSCLSYFFEIPWNEPAPGLTEQVKAAVLDWAGFALRALGRLGEALEPMKAGKQLRVAGNDWKNAAAAASNISQLLVTLGDLKQALDYGKQCVDYADKSGDGFHKESKRTAYADALFQAGETVQAEALFAEVEAMQNKSQPGYPYLYSLQGFRFCDLLLSQGKYKEVLERARTNLSLAGDEYWLLGKALDNLSIGKALLLEAVKNVKPDVSEAKQFLHLAVDGLRESGRQDCLPWGLFARAALYRYKQQFALSWEDLEEAREVAHYGSMKLHLTDYYLEACRNVKKVIGVRGGRPGKASQEWCFIIEEGEKMELPVDGMKEKFREFLEEAERLIGDTGYHRRDGELAELEEWAEDVEW